MTINDPFADAPAEQPAPEPSPIVSKEQAKKDLGLVTPPSEGGLSITFKGGRDFDAAWIVPKYAGVREALLDLGVSSDEVDGMSPSLRWAALFERVQKMSASFTGVKPVSAAAAANAGQATRQAPQGATEAPSWAGQAPDGYKYATGVKNGRTWHAWFPIERDGGEKIWLNPPK